MRTVADAMSPVAVTVEPAMTLQAASAAMLDAGVQAAVVVKRGRFCGLLTAEAITRALAEGYDVRQTLVSAVAERHPAVARPDEPLAEVHQRMRAEQRGLAAVTGRRDEPLGLLEDPEAAV
jgi:predicted transcriptional regulator